MGMGSWKISVLILLAALCAAAALVWALLRRRGESNRAPSDDTATGDAPKPKRRTPKPSAPTAPEPSSLQAVRADAMRKLQVVAFGVPLTADPTNEDIISAVGLTLAGIVDKPNYAPRRPLLLPKLVQAMNDSEVSRRELSAIIGSDPGLASGLLRLANSPFYRISNEPIESLDRAVAVLGIEGMRSLVSAALMQPVFRISGGAFAQFGDVTWEHTLRSGAAAEAHAAILENSDPFAAQLLSLMMGLATIVVFRVGVDEFLARKIPPHAGTLAALIDAQSAIVARHVAASWELSDRMDEALADQNGTTPKTSLGRSLLFGRFLGALSVLHSRQVINDDGVSEALRTDPLNAEAYQRIWTRLSARP